jgi:hypothetical protein
VKGIPLLFKIELQKDFSPMDPLGIPDHQISPHSHYLPDAQISSPNTATRHRDHRASGGGVSPVHEGSTDPVCGVRRTAMLIHLWRGIRHAMADEGILEGHDHAQETQATCPDRMPSLELCRR